MNEFSVHFELLPLPVGWWLWMALLGLLILLLVAWKLRELLPSRLLAVTAFVLLAAMPYVTRYTLAPLPPVVLIIVDQSASMQLGDRPKETRQMLGWLQKTLRENEMLEVERHDLGDKDTSQTEIFSDLSAIIKKYNPERIAAVFLITDGQVADAAAAAWPGAGPPLHLLLVGDPREQQAYLEIAQTQPYAMIGDTVRLRVKAHWPITAQSEAETILSIHAGRLRWREKIPLNEWTTLPLPIRHAGQNRFILALPPFDNAVFPAAQTAIADITGIADKIHISVPGETPSAAWFQALADDPAVRLSHDNSSAADIVILNELFTTGQKSVSHDELIRYIRKGSSALIIQSGVPPEISPDWQEILPLQWSAQPAESKITATANGMAHPVTADILHRLTALTGTTGAEIKSGHDAKALLATPQQNPLLTLAEYQGSRLAIITDTTLLQQDFSLDLLRNIMRWLMHDPEMSDRAITARAQNGVVEIEYLSDRPAIRALQITRPDRTRFELPLSVSDSGLNTTAFTPVEAGIYLISDGVEETAYIHGNAAAPEFTAATATAARLAPLVHKTGGGILWIKEMPEPALRWVTSRQRGGKDWLPLRESRAVVSTGAMTETLLPKFFLMLLAASALGYAWWRESR